MKEFGKEMIRVRSEYQLLEVNLERLIGNKGKADQLMSEIIEFAGWSPFDVATINEGATQLLSYGMGAETVTNTLTQLGDIAVGLSMPLSDIVSMYGNVVQQGELSRETLDQFSASGIPMVQTLARQFGLANEEIYSLVEQGRIGFPEVQRAISAMTNEGGAFYGEMEKQSQTLQGQIDNLKDAWAAMLNAAGTESEGMLSMGIEGATALIRNYETIGKVLATLTAAYGVGRATLLIYNLATAADGVLKTVQIGLTERLNLAMIKLNLTMLKNPAVLIAMGVATLVGIMISLCDWTTSAEKAQGKYNAEKEAAIQYEEEHKRKIEDLLSIATNQSMADIDRVEALRQLKAEYPKIFEKYDLESIKLADILEKKRMIADEDTNRARIGRITQLIMLDKEIGALQGEIDIRKGKRTGKTNMEYRGTSTTKLQSRLEEAQELRELKNKDVSKDNANKVLSNMSGLSDKDLKQQSIYLNDRMKGASKNKDHVLDDGLFKGTFSYGDIELYDDLIQGELKKRKEPVFDFSQREQALVDALNVAKSKRAALIKGSYSDNQWEDVLTKADKDVSDADKKLNDFRKKAGISTSPKSAKPKKDDEVQEAPEKKELRELKDENEKRKADKEKEQETARIEAIEDEFARRREILNREYDGEINLVKERMEELAQVKDDGETITELLKELNNKKTALKSDKKDKATIYKFTPATNLFCL